MHQGTSRRVQPGALCVQRAVALCAGQLKCVGSPLFLKRTFGVGYNLTITRSRPVSLKELVRKHVAGASQIRCAGCSRVVCRMRVHAADRCPRSDAGAEVSFRLPLEGAAAFPALLGVRACVLACIRCGVVCAV
jgi:hypothetical protein